MCRQPGREILNKDKWGAQIHSEMPSPTLARHRLDRVVGKDRGIVDQAANWPELALGARQQRRNGSFIGEVGSERNRSAAFTADQCSQPFSGIARAVIMNRDSETLLGERQRESTADPLCAARYQCGPRYRVNR